MCVEMVVGPDYNSAIQSQIKLIHIFFVLLLYIIFLYDLNQFVESIIELIQLAQLKLN